MLRQPLGREVFTGTALLHRLPDLLLATLLAFGALDGTFTLFPTNDTRAFDHRNQVIHVRLDLSHHLSRQSQGRCRLDPAPGP